MSGVPWARGAGASPGVLRSGGQARRPEASPRNRLRSAWPAGHGSRHARNRAQGAPLCAPPGGASVSHRAAQVQKRCPGRKRALGCPSGGATHASIGGCSWPATRPQAATKVAKVGGAWEERVRLPATACERAARHGLASPCSSRTVPAWCQALPRLCGRRLGAPSGREGGPATRPSCRPSRSRRQRLQDRGRGQEHGPLARAEGAGPHRPRRPKSCPCPGQCCEPSARGAQDCRGPRAGAGPAVGARHRRARGRVACPHGGPCADTGLSCCPIPQRGVGARATRHANCSVLLTRGAEPATRGRPGGPRPARGPGLRAAVNPPGLRGARGARGRVLV
jgi:hypothetical protein